MPRLKDNCRVKQIMDPPSSETALDVMYFVIRIYINRVIGVMHGLGGGGSFIFAQKNTNIVIICRYKMLIKETQRQNRYIKTLGHVETKNYNIYYTHDIN